MTFPDHELEIAARFLLAAVLGGLLGFDREVKNRPAGLRTHMLIALAAALFTAITFEIHETIIRGGGSGTDPIRIIEAVTAGVAFLAAGAIIQSGRKITGLTTGAGMWMAGALGVASGSGYYAIAIIAAAFAMFILSAISWIDDRFVQSNNPNAEKPQKNRE
jgi:putative Mg2+ transporter-C (MgtC) family protein